MSKIDALQPMKLVAHTHKCVYVWLTQHKSPSRMSPHIALTSAAALPWLSGDVSVSVCVTVVCLSAPLADGGEGGLDTDASVDGKRNDESLTSLQL